jgi:hypothetical protein
MMLDLLVQFIVELLRSLLIEALSNGVRDRTRQLRSVRSRRGVHRAVFVVHRRNRERLFNKLLTESL